jgi:malonyl-CoA O-methyltransferase
MTKPTKARVRRSFEKAASTYDQAAEVQRRICDRLAASLPDQPLRCLLDAGCGTGYALPLLQDRYPDARVLTLDLSVGMLTRVPTAALRLAGDLEHLPLAAHSLDLYWSSLAVQWCDLPAVLHEARRTLRSGGTLRLATLGPATFRELRHAFAGIDQHDHTLGFLSPDAILAAAQAAGFPTVDLVQYTETAHYPDLSSLLRAVKAVGANQVGEGRRTSLMSRQALARVEAAFETLRTPAGLPLSYDVISLSAQA